MEKFTKFIKSPSAPVFALGAMMLTFLTLYSKLYYATIPEAYKVNFVVDLLTSLVVGAGLCTITFVIMIHSKNKKMPILFAFLDFTGGCLFYGNDIVNLWNSSDFVVIGQGAFFAIMKSVVIYFCAEIFMNEAEEIEKNSNTENQQITNLQAKLDSLINQNNHKDNQLSQKDSELIDLKNAISSLNSDLNAKDSDLKSVSDRFKAYQDRAKVWHVEYLEKLIADAGKSRRGGVLPEHKLQEIAEYKKELESIS